MPYAKTDLAAQLLKQRDRAQLSLSLSQRTALILFDGKRTVQEVLRQTAGLGVQMADIQQLLRAGLLRDDSGAREHANDVALADFPGSTLSPPSVLATPDLPEAEQQRRYQAAYPLATQLTAGLGLRGFRLNLAVERAEGYLGLLQLLPKIEEAAGADRCAALRGVLHAHRPQ
ncbi:hypothetical protein [Ottowia oryzae]